MKYVADDGTYFNTEAECMKYEEEQKAIFSCFILYDENLNVVSVEDTYRIEYLHILSRPFEVAECIYQNCGYERDGIDGVGIYKIHEDGYWQKIDDLIVEHTKQLESLKAVKIGILQQQANQDSGYDAV